jgi:hypothetical protein
MWISFPIGRRMRLGVPLVFLPVVIVFYAAAVMVWIALLIITAPVWLLLKLAQALTKSRAHAPARPSGARVTIHIKDDTKPGGGSLRRWPRPRSGRQTR